MFVYLYIYIYIYVYVNMKVALIFIYMNDIISAGDDLFDQWDPSTVVPMEDICRAQGTMLTNKPCSIKFHDYIYIYIYVCVYIHVLFLCFISNDDTYICVCIYPSLLAEIGYDTRSILNSGTGLNSELSFSCIHCSTKDKEPCLPFCSSIV